MKQLEAFFDLHPNARILDVGTGNGNFIFTILSVTDNYDEIVGIDDLDLAVSTARKNFQRKRDITILKMDAYHMDFEDRIFDIVTISNAIHHVPELGKLMKELERVVKPSGTIIISEVIQDNPTSRQKSNILLHHFAAEIDRELGLYHNETYTKKALLKDIKASTTRKIDKHWILEIPSHVDTEEEITWLLNTVDTLTEHIKDETRIKHYQEKALTIKNYIKENGFDSAPQMIVLLKR